ncbi:MAG: hypothetical protein V3V59_01155 [Thermodesulfovibrionales bacterium]
MERVKVYFTIVFLFFLNSNVFSDPLGEYAFVYANYPKSKNIIGVGEVEKSGNMLKDKRVAEVLARLEIAKQIKVKLREETLDIACEGTSGKVFSGGIECKNEFVMVIEETVDEVLVGSSIVDNGQRGSVVFAIAVLPRDKTGGGLEKNVQKSVDRARESIQKAKEGDKGSLKDAREEYVKAVTYDKEKEIIEGVRSRASAAFNDLEKELIKLK